MEWLTLTLTIHKNRIIVSNTKKPFFFYADLDKLHSKPLSIVRLNCTVTLYPFGLNLNVEFGINFGSICYSFFF